MFVMGEFGERLSWEGLTSLLSSNSQLDTIPIRTKAFSNSNSNLIDGYGQQGGSPGSLFSDLVSHRRKFHSMDDIFDAVHSKRKLPTRRKCQRQRIKKNPFGIMSDCVPSPESDSYASTSASGGSTGSSSPTCEISLLERLIRTHPVWFLPSLQRSGALHLLQGRDVGNFIIRSSTQPKTMAVSVKLPGPGNVEHYLLKANGNKISLENSAHAFSTVHQLVAYYCETREEIPVSLVPPAAIANATSRQQLASLALLGQEFWSVPEGNLSPKDSPSDIDGSRSIQLLGSHSSSNHSLSEISKRPCRPSTLELGSTATPTAPPVPVRWSRSTLLTPMSQPSSTQTTPSEMQSTFSDRSGRPGKKKKRNSGGNKAESIHYKDTEILTLDVFKGTKTMYDDKASDYEDIWSPQHHERSHTPKLSTFKPDLIPRSHTPETENFDIGENANASRCNTFQSKSVTPPDHLTVQNVNAHNNRLSFNGQNINLSTSTDNYMSKSNSNVDSCVQNDVNRRSGLYSEPVDSITYRKGGNRNAEPSIRWSQPTLSLLKLDFNNGDLMANVDNVPFGDNWAGSGQGKPSIVEPNLKVETKHGGSANRDSKIGQHAISITRSSADVSSANKSVKQVCTNKSGSHKSGKARAVTCASVDNLCHLRDSFKKPKTKPQMISREDDPAEDFHTRSKSHSTNITTSNVIEMKTEGRSHNDMTPTMDIPNKSWSVDNSWELVMWQKEEEKRLKESAAKFPVIPSPPSTPKLKHATTPSESSQTENSLGSTNNNSVNEGYNSLRRFSCYDNLERSKAETNAEEETDSDEDKISPPWDSSKWEHLMRIISESTQQLDLISSVGNSGQYNASLRGRDISRPGVIPNQSEPSFPGGRMLGAGGNVDKATKSISGVVKNLSNKEDGVFGPTLRSFISCTIAAKLQDPYRVMRNVRQFISGMKNYLVGVNTESEELRKEIKKQTETLNSSEFLNIDVILESVLVDLVISPLHLHVRGLLEAYIAKNGEPLYLPMDPGSAKQDDKMISRLKNIYNGFEESISPMTKLDKWNEFVCQVQEMDNYSTDSFLPLLSETLGNICTSKLPAHVDYMIGLIPTTLAEQNNYSLSMLQSAVSALRVKVEARKGSSSLTSVKVLIPDERNGTLVRKMVPVRNSTTNKEVAKIVASKLGITNPSDYVLVTIKNGEETVCPESELVHSCVDEGATALAYKRLDAKIGWPSKIS